MIEILAKMLGVTGATIGVFYLLYKQVIDKVQLPGLTKKQAFNLLVILLILIWLFAIFIVVFHNGGLQLGHININNNSGGVEIE